MNAYRSGVQVPRTARAAFTLLEMLVVVVVIGVLAGLVLYIINAAGAHNARVTTVQHIEKVRAALEEYYAIYGQYPPVPVSIQSRPESIQYFVPTNQSSPDNFSFGLTSFLMCRITTAKTATQNATIPGMFNGSLFTWGSNNPPITAGQPQDPTAVVNAVNRWWPMIQDIVVKKDGNGIGVPYTIQDGWGYDLYYWSPPPYQTYDIWSAGTDHLSGGPLAGITNPQYALDDIHSSPGK